MTTVAQNKSLVDRFNKEFLEGQQLEAFHELISPEFVNHVAPPGRQGFDNTLQFFQQILWPALSGLKVEILDQFGEGDRVVTRKILHAVQEAEILGMPASHAPVSIGVIDIFRIAEGQLVEHWAMTDTKQVH
jgi:predicted SnoaL-like aldol condensation-catalyzing enzyme